MCSCIPKLKECCKKIIHVAATQRNKLNKQNEKRIELKLDERYYKRQRRFVVP
jgi:hypothetical protein